MLVLARKKDQKIFLKFGETVVEISVMEIHQGKVRLGFIAPQEVKIYRDDFPLSQPQTEEQDASQVKQKPATVANQDQKKRPQNPR